MFVDYIMIVGTKADVRTGKEKLSSPITTTYLRICTHFVCIKTERRPYGQFLTQISYAQKIVALSRMQNAKPLTSPLPLAHALYEVMLQRSKSERAEMDCVSYMQLLVTLLFLSKRSGADICTAVSRLETFQAEHNVLHWKAMKHVIRYLIGNSEYGVLLPKGQPSSTLVGWSDANWARDLTTSRLRSGCVLRISKGRVFWASRLRCNIAMSTSASEFNALSYFVRKIKWVRSVLEELGVPQSSPTVLNQDNLGAICCTSNI